MYHSFTTKQMGRRAGTILRSFRTGAAQPNAEIIRELAELTAALEDAPVKPDVVARLTVTRANNEKVIVEVNENATFSNFYVFFKQTGNRRSTKAHIRTSNRNDAPGLESLAQKLSLCQSQSNPITNTRIKIYRKRAYRKLLSLRPDELGLTQCDRVPVYSRFSVRSS